MNEVLTLILQSAAASGPVAGLLLIAVWYQTKGNRELISQLNKQIEGRLRGLEEHVEECDADRRELRNKLFDLLQASKISIIIGACLLVSSCQSWQARRTYSIYIEDQHGRRAGAGLLIEPTHSNK